MDTEQDDYISVYEYEKNVNPHLDNVPFFEKGVSECDYGIHIVDFSNIFHVSHRATTPNLLASFIKVASAEAIELNNNQTTDDFNATSHLFYIINGSGSVQIDADVRAVSSGDILIAPCFHSFVITNDVSNTQFTTRSPLSIVPGIPEFTSRSPLSIVPGIPEDLQIYYVNDSPLVNYLGNKACKQIFKTALFKREFLFQKLNELSDPNNNRKGILLSNKDTDLIGINTITPTLWALFNEIPPNTIQKPHKHNSVALDLCIKCEDPENVYTLIGDELDEHGNILNPKKVNWKEGTMFITPPGLWHSHNNAGETHAYILPVQDAGLLLYQRILGIILKK